MASFMLKLPTTGPSVLLPSTKAVAGDSLMMTGSSFEFVVPACTSRTYMSSFLNKIYPLFIPLIQLGNFHGTELHRYARNNQLLSLLHKLSSPNEHPLALGTLGDPSPLTSAFKKFLKTLTTKSLLTQYKCDRPYSRNLNDATYLPRSIGSGLLVEELATREHVPRARDKNLISLMSKHAGKKLTLQESQKLSNRLKKKEN